MKTRQRQLVGFFLLSLLPLSLGSGCVRYAKWDDGWKGRPVGKYRLTVYWLAHQRNYRGPRRGLLMHRGRLMKRVPSRFVRALRMQGSGRLRNGRIVQVLRRCRWKRHCVHVRLISSRRYPSGVGAAGRPLRPLRSVAADTRFAFGTRLYIPRLRLLLRQRGRTHNGCFVVHDRGGRIRGARLDLFTGNRLLYQRYLRGRLPRYVRVYRYHPRCRSRR